LKPDEILLEVIPMRATRYYKVALPSRPTIVTVTVTKNSGVSPSLYGSTRIKRPDDRNNDYKGKDDKLVYEHVLARSAEDGEDTEREQQRPGVPDSREFYFTATASGGESNFKIQVSFRGIKIKLTEQALQMSTKIKHGWEAKLAEITKNQMTRDEFDEHLLIVQEQRKAKQEDLSRGVDFVHRNVSRMAPEASPREKAIRAQKAALRACFKQDMAQQLREELDREKEAQNVAWLNRAENKRKEREQQEKELAQLMKYEELQKGWIKTCMTVGFIVKTHQQLEERKRVLDKLRVEYASASILHGFFRRYLVHKRRHDMWKNALKLRNALTFYCRSALPLRKSLAAPVLRAFLENHTYNKETPSVTSALERFRGHIVRMQRTFLKNKLVRNAYVTMLWPTFLEVKAVAYAAYGEEQAAARLAAEKLEQERMALLEKMAKGGDTKSSSKHAGGTKRRGSQLRVSVVNRQEDPEEEIPDWLGRKVLYDHVVTMQKSYVGRVKAWEDQLKEASSRLEVQQFAGTGAGEEEVEVHELKQNKPRRVYVDQKELLELINKHMKIWHSSGYSHLKKNRMRLLYYGMKAFAGERSLHRRGSLKNSHRGKAAPKSRKKKTEHHESADGEEGGEGEEVEDDDEEGDAGRVHELINEEMIKRMVAVQEKTFVTAS